MIIPANLNLGIVQGSTLEARTIEFYDIDGNPSVLTGWSIFAQARNSKGELEVDLKPEFTDDTTGKAKFPELSDEDTALFKLGDFDWDLLLEDPDGKTWGPFVIGTLSVIKKVTVIPAP